GPERTDAIGMEAGIEKAFWNTGGRLSASVFSGAAKIKISPIWGFPESFYQNQLNLTYLHPLLKNRDGFLDKLQHSLKQYDVDFAEVQALEKQEDFLTMASGKFLDWVLLTEQAQIMNERKKLSEDELIRTKRKRSANLVDEVDVLRAEDAVQIAEQNRVLIQAHWKALQAELAILSNNEAIKEQIPDFNVFEVQALPSIEDATTKIKTASRLLNTIDIRIQQMDVLRKGNEEIYKPDLSVFAQMNTKKLDEDVPGSLKMDKYDVAFGLSLQVPLGRRTAKHQIQKHKLQIEQLKIQKNEIELSLVSALTNLMIQINELEAVLTLNKQQIESARKKTEEELKLYNQGRGSLTFVILSRDGEENAKLIYTQNAVQYHKLIIQYRSLMDELI
ncbi:MAG: TolC family protein, partial [Calditrichaeota bacterium]